MQAIKRPESEAPATPPDSRVLFMAPTTRDGATTTDLLRAAGIDVTACQTLEDVISLAREGAGVILVPEETVSSGRAAGLAALLAEQPPWSDLPVLVLTRPGADSAELSDAIHALGNVTLLERPVRVATLLSAVSTALRARARQYQIRGHLAERARAEQSLRRADRRKDEFLATLGHELRNPLAPLVTGLQLLKTAGPRDAVSLRVGAVMERQVNHLIRLVDDLLEVSRITRNVIELERESLDLRSVLRSAVDTIRPAIDQAGHRLALDLPVDPMRIRGDVVRLTQVFVNLLTNAIKYTDAGGRVWLSARLAGDRAIVEVRDDGIGIAPAHLETVFDMFTQVDRTGGRKAAWASA
jgi:signal transduction histidine kinase